MDTVSVFFKIRRFQTSSVPTSDISEQVGAVFFNLVDSFSQVEIKNSDKSSEITSDLGTYNNTHSQTQFLCPGSENDPYSDNYRIGRHCNNVSCRYAGRSARPFSSRGPLYKCNLCNIVLCQNCKDESAHDDMCTQNFTFFKNGPWANMFLILVWILINFVDIFNHLRYPEMYPLFLRGSCPIGPFVARRV